jgi:uncharacterized membrane protein (TIGR02234 family)
VSEPVEAVDPDEAVAAGERVKGRSRQYAPFALALVLDLVGAGGALLVAPRHWQTISTARRAPLGDLVVQVTGRNVDAAPTALALVALAGVVAVLATRGIVRRVVGGVLALSGVALVWRAIASAGAVSTGRARTLVADKRASADLTDVVPQVTTHGVWPALTVVCGLLVLAAGALIAWRGHRWQVMSARYEAPADPQQQQTKAATALWTALDNGDDPTNGP